MERAMDNDEILNEIQRLVGFYKRLCRERSLEYDEQALVDFDACKIAIDRLKDMPRD